MLSTAAVQASPLPAFPGAEGFATYSTGGRGGDVYQVTNLNPKGPGSFDEAISTVPPQGRTIVFSVSGFIPISKARLTSSKVTIAGQTAPGGGICLKGSSFTISGSDVVIRHLRFRHGHDGNGGDCINPDGGADRLIIDHCDVMFSNDENLSSFRTAPPNFTFQWSTNAWGLYGHSCGGLWLVDHASCHHTLWANNKTRNPKVIRAKLLDWTNNVTFGWDIGMNLAGGDVPGLYQANIRGSTFIQGSRGRNPVFGGGVLPDGSMPWHVHMSDCALDGNGATQPDVTATDYALIDRDQYHRSDTPFLPPPNRANGIPPRPDDRLTAYKKVISQVGPLRMDVKSNLPLRDEVTSLLVSDVVRQQRRKITHEKELDLPNNGFGTLESDVPAADSDKDGMPDDWEAALGFDPGRQDHNELLAESSFMPSSGGYTRLEEYLHFLAIPHGRLRQGETVRIDLSKFTMGFGKAPRYVISHLSTGKATVDANGHALFTAPENHTGRASFDFTVTDAEGSTWTQTCAFVITH